MLQYKSKQSSFHCLLYNKIPENHILKQVKKAVDFSFINDLLCKNFGRLAKESKLEAITVNIKKNSGYHDRYSFLFWRKIRHIQN